MQSLEGLTQTLLEIACVDPKKELEVEDTHEPNDGFDEMNDKVEWELTHDPGEMED